MSRLVWIALVLVLVIPGMAVAHATPNHLPSGDYDIYCPHIGPTIKVTLRSSKAFRRGDTVRISIPSGCVWIGKASGGSR